VTARASATAARPVTAPESRRRTVLLSRVATFALVIGLWLVPTPAGLTSQAWHLFAIFAAAIFSVIVTAFPLLTAALLAAAAAVLTGTITPAKAFAGFANGSVLLVVVAFLVATSVVKSGLGHRISLLVVSAFGRSTLGLAYSIFLTDAAIAPAFPSNTARSGVLFPIVLSLAQGAGSTPVDDKTRRVGGYLMFCGMASLAVSSALWLTATSVNPIGAEIARQFDLKISFGSWLLAGSVPALAAILLLPLVLYWLFPPGVRATPDAPAAARKALQTMGPLTRDEKVVAVAFVLMVTGWVSAGTLKLDLTAVAFAGLGALLATSVLTLDDIAKEGGTLATYLWLAVLFAMSGQLNELGFMSYVGGRLSSALEGVPWPAAYVALLVLYVLMHYLFVSQSSQVLALFGVFVDVGLRAGVPASLMAFALLFASSYFSTITPQGGSQNVIFVGSGYLTQGELYRLGALTTAFCLLVYLVVGTPWLLMIMR
jgi:divalent anion:Na+ symporter, DASS family